MATNASNIILGAATVSYGDYVTAGGAGSLTDVGHTKGPVEMTPEVTDFDVRSERAFGILRKVPQEGAYSLKVPMLESTIEHMRAAFRQPTSRVSGTPPDLTLLLGDPQEQYHQVECVGPGLGTTSLRTCTFWKAIAGEVGPVTYAKGDTMAIDVTFGIMYDDSVATADKYGKIVDS